MRRKQDIIAANYAANIQNLKQFTSILDLQLDGVVCYGNPANGDVLVTDVVQGIQFTEEPKELKQGDKFMEITLPFIALRVTKK